MLGIVSLACAAWVFTLCAQELPEILKADSSEIKPTIIDKFHSLGEITVQNKETVHPLVKQSRRMGFSPCSKKITL